LISIGDKIYSKVNEYLPQLAWHIFPNNSDRETVEKFVYLTKKNTP